MALNPNHDRMKAAGFDRETLETIERTMAVTLSPERQAAARLEQEQKQREAIRHEQEALRALADAAETGKYGPEGKELARQLLVGGRTQFNLSALRSAIKRLR